MIQQYLQDVEPGSLKVMLGLLWIVLAAAVIVYALKPAYTEFNSSHGSLELLRDQVDDHTQLQLSINEERKTIDELRHKLHGESGNLPIKEVESYLIGRLQGLSWDSGIELIAVKPGHARRVLEFDELSFEVEVEGEYKKLYKWLNTLSENLGFVLVSKYDIRTKGNNKDDLLKMNVTVVFYRMPG